MRKLEPTMKVQVEIYLSHLLASSPALEPVNMSPRCNWLTADILRLLSFGEELNFQPGELWISFLEAFKVGSRISLTQLNSYSSC